MATQASDYRTDIPREAVSVYPTTTVVTGRIRRISWGAVFAGIVISLVTMIALQMLGLAVGAATVNPLSEVDPLEPGLAAGTMLWAAASNLIALFLGGYVAGRMSGLTDDADGALHGLVTWAMVTLISLFVITTSIGNVINGLMGAASQALSTAGQVVAEVSPEVADALDMQEITWQGIQGEVRRFVIAAEGTTVTDTTDTTTQPSTSADTTPSLTEIEINRAIRTVFDQETINDTDRQNLVMLLVERAGMTEAEAQASIERWEQAYVQVRTEAEETARVVGQRVADGLTVLAGALFAAMIIGAFAAGAGGIVGTPSARELAARSR